MITVDLPHNERVEQALLAELLTDNSRVPLVADRLSADHFYDPLHGRIFAAVIALVNNGGEANPTTLWGVLRRAPEAADAPGGVDAYIAKLYEACAFGDVKGYARVLEDLYQRRCLIEIAQRVIADAQELAVSRTSGDIMDELESSLLLLDEATPRAQPLVIVKDAVQEAIDAAEAACKAGTALTGVTTGLKDLDWRLGGLQPGELIVLGARPSMGKSDLAWNIAVNAGDALARGLHGGAGVLMFSQEMVARQLGARFLARAAGVATDRQRRGEVTDAEFIAFTQAIPNLPVWIDSTARVTPAHVMRRARRLKQKHGLGMVIIDHLNIMGAPDGFRSKGETEVITEITRELKGVATTLGVPVLLLSQLSRQVETRDDKRPTLADLRQSGSIEQDADTVMFLYRDEYYLGRSEPAQRSDETTEKYNDRLQHWQQRKEASRNLAEVIVAKQRMGAVGTVSLYYDGARSAFFDLER
ncbi:DnaB-like helicase C-terminal domain-containing protein [Azospirillum brasilense]|uniref:DnaB-like helicase C-terminal domain-containing protein n=1 Tax=Azospirillum brasilense TaxID=192 RepID=UPI001EDBAA9B|nr:DnaB-like helicase C-terminal domain-containing protein [Azospirillum brasilense]UKJ74251.1 AAA family ATPase [Azospirillum brasilense]